MGMGGQKAQKLGSRCLRRGRSQAFELFGLSPYGLAPPDPWENMRRLLGGGSSWRASPETCPDGLLILRGPGVARHHQVGGMELTDVAPTLCYLLGLPVARYMDGRLISEAVEARFLATHPLQVVD